MTSHILNTGRREVRTKFWLDNFKRHKQIVRFTLTSRSENIKIDFKETVICNHELDLAG
jgi:hypothetical protein